MKKILVSVLIVALLCNFTCFAANSIKGTYNEATKEVYVEGHLDEYKNAPAAVWILKDGKENLTGLTKTNINDYLLHLEQVITNEDGEFNFTYKVNNEGIYNTFVKSFDGSLKGEGMIVCRGSSYYLELIEKIEALRDAENKNDDIDSRVASLKLILNDKGVYDALKIYQTNMPDGVKLDSVSDNAYKILLSYNKAYPTTEGEFAKIFIDSVVVDIFNSASEAEIAGKYDNLKSFLPSGYDLIIKEYKNMKTSNETGFNSINKILSKKFNGFTQTNYTIYLPSCIYLF